jgi:hypothetical protein
VHHLPWDERSNIVAKLGERSKAASTMLYGTEGFMTRVGAFHTKIGAALPK